MLSFETTVKMLGTAIFEVVEAEGGQFFKSLEFGPEKNMFKFKDLFLNPQYKFDLSNAIFFPDQFNSTLFYSCTVWIDIEVLGK